MIKVDELAQEIRRVDGDHKLGAAALAEALKPFIDEKIRAAGLRGYCEAQEEKDYE